MKITSHTGFAPRITVTFIMGQLDLSLEPPCPSRFKSGFEFRLVPGRFSAKSRRNKQESGCFYLCILILWTGKRQKTNGFLQWSDHNDGNDFERLHIIGMNAPPQTALFRITARRTNMWRGRNRNLYRRIRSRSYCRDETEIWRDNRYRQRKQPGRQTTRLARALTELLPLLRRQAITATPCLGLFFSCYPPVVWRAISYIPESAKPLKSYPLLSPSPFWGPVFLSSFITLQFYHNQLFVRLYKYNFSISNKYVDIIPAQIYTDIVDTVSA